jgi:hypothetical protein
MSPVFTPGAESDVPPVFVDRFGAKAWTSHTGEPQHTCSTHWSDIKGSSRLICGEPSNGMVVCGCMLRVNVYCMPRLVSSGAVGACTVMVSVFEAVKVRQGLQHDIR